MMRPIISSLCAALAVLVGIALTLLRVPSLDLVPIDLTGKRYLVTGCTIKGLGFESAAILAEWNATVFCTVRSDAKGLQLLEEVAPRLKNTRGSIEYLLVDFGSFKQVRSFANSVLQKMPRIDGVLFNAGGHMLKALSEDGLDQEFQVNHYAQFLLLRLLEQRIVESAPSRLVFVSSSAVWNAGATVDRAVYHHKQRPQGKPGLRGYADAKLFQILTALALKKRFEKLNVNVTANTVAPGLVLTNFTAVAAGDPDVDRIAAVLNVAPWLARNLREGAARGIHVLTSPEHALSTGKHFHDYLNFDFLMHEVHDDNAEWVWRESSLLVGVDP